METPLSLVNPRQGTASHYGFSRGNTLPLVARPFGMTAWSPQTDEGSWLFNPECRKIQGIRATRQPSPWIGDYGHFVVMAEVGAPCLSAGRRASTVRPEELEIRPHYVRANLLRYQTIIEMTPTERCAIFRFTFPASDQSRILLEPHPGDSQIVFDPENGRLSGYTRARTGGTPGNFACYFVATFSRSYTRFAPFHRDQYQLGQQSQTGERIGGFVEFETETGETIEMQIATSFISLAQAEQNLANEIGEDDFQAIQKIGEDIWNAALSKIQISGGTKDQRRTFYTCFYRAQLFPRVWHEYDLQGDPIHFSPYDGKIHDGVLYADNGFWDTYRTVYPFLALLLPERLAEILEGWTNAAKEGGWFPQWASPGYRACMIGTHIDAVMADAVVKGIRGFDLETAYARMRRHAFEPGDEAGNYGRLGIAEYLSLGYVSTEHQSSATSRTLDYAYDDFCLFQIAHALGHEDDAKIFQERAFSYRNVYDPTVGMMRGRHADGSWLTPFDPLTWGSPYVEGGAWQSTWAVPHDPAGLIALMGGPEPFVARLDEMMTMPPYFHVGSYGFEIHEMTEMACAGFGQYAHSNQPVHHVLSLYACAGQPWKTEYWVRRVLNELYSPDILPGDEDNGEMCIWYIFHALGLYPLCPGHPSYVFSTPLFDEARISLPENKTLTIRARDNNADNMYVQSLSVNGKSETHLWIDHNTLIQGGEIEFQLGPAPNTERMISPADLPFSFSLMDRDPSDEI